VGSGEDERENTADQRKRHCDQHQQRVRQRVEGRVEEKQDDHQTHRHDHRQAFLFGRELIVLTGPFKPIPFRERNRLSHLGLGLLHRALQVAVADAELDRNIPFVVFPINDECAGLSSDRRHLFQGNPRTVRRIHQNIADGLGIPSKLGKKPNHQIEQALALVDLRHPLTAHRRLHHRIDVGHAQPVPGAGFPIHLDQQIGLSY